ncbi:MAG: hypothetical protein MUF47_01275 [Porphyrobacter sp.]|jgi:hypothetical protein|nr:hypothetical protein [Porphyrobacter sp.]
MEVLSAQEIDTVNGGFVRDFSRKDAKEFSKITIWGGGAAVGSNRLAYEKYLAELAAWQARHPNLDPSIFDSIYFRK